MYHAELLDIENERNIKVVPSVLNAEQVIRLQEYAIKHNLVTLIEVVNGDVFESVECEVLK